MVDGASRPHGRNAALWGKPVALIDLELRGRLAQIVDGLVEHRQQLARAA